MKKTITCFSLFLLLSSCEKSFYGEIEPYERQLFLFASYTNANSNNPAITLDIANSSKAIQINPSDTSASIDINTNRINLGISNIRLSDELGTYKINSIKTEEYQNGKWAPDTENFLRPESAKQLDVVLVLDVSNSLGGDVQDVKNYASEFVDFLFSENPNSRIGIVGFSENISTFPLSTSPNAAKSFINGLQGDNATKLYEAMDTGIDMIEGSTADGRALVTFTDGKNNSWSDVAKYSTPDLVYNRLVTSTVSSYTIGLKGKNEGVDEAELSRLAVRGLFKFPSNITELSPVFQKFANSVAATYVLVYDRNISQIINPIKLRFTINTTVY